MVRRLVVLSTAVIATAGAAAVPVSAVAQTPPTAQTLTLTEPGSGGTFDFVDRPPKSHGRERNMRFSVGDALVITNPVRDASGKKVGRVRAVCWVTKAGGFDKAAADCLGVFTLASGNLYVTLPGFTFSGSSASGAVVAGTGAYQGLHGTWTSVDHADESSTDTFNLAP